MDPEVKHVEPTVQPPDAKAKTVPPPISMETAQESYEASLTAYNTQRHGNMNVSHNGLTPTDEIESPKPKNDPPKKQDHGNA